MVGLIQTRSLAQIVLVSAVLSSQMLPTEAANILFFIGLGGPSHRIAMQPLADTLAERGHNVTFLALGLPKDNSSKVKYYEPKKLSEFFGPMMAGDTDMFSKRASGLITFGIFFLQQFGIQVCENLYSDPEFLEWMNDNKFDLVFIDGLLNDCGYGIAHAHNAKTILFSISTVLPWAIEGIGIPDETSYVPDVMLGFSPDMGFIQRTLSAVMPVFWKMFRHSYYLPKMTRITKEGLGKTDIPCISEMERNTSLVFLNTHASQEYPRSLPPNIIPIGGISWVEKKKPLPKKFEDFIAQGKEGFVYVSFGSFMNFLTFPAETQQRFINALARFPNIQFIWKLNKTPANLPSNILVDKWMPQQDILRHPKIRAFVTHSGIGGVNEAIYTSVPLILFPLMNEQDYNAFLVQKKGFGIKMEITTLTEDGFEKAITEILTNDSYKVNAKKVTSQFLDRPMTPLDSAVWWTEYALRQDTSFLRPANVRQSWWVKRQLDVWLFVFLVLISFNVTSIYVIYKIFKKCCGVKSKKALKQKQKKN